MEQVESKPVELRGSEVRAIVRSDNHRRYIERLMRREYQSNVKRSKTRWAGWKGRRNPDGTIYFVTAWRDTPEPKPEVVKTDVGTLTLPEWFGKMYEDRPIEEYDPNAPLVRDLPRRDGRRAARVDTHDPEPDPDTMPQNAEEFREQLWADRMEYIQQASKNKWREQGMIVTWALASHVATKYTYRHYYPVGAADQADERRKQAF